MAVAMFVNMRTLLPHPRLSERRLRGVVSSWASVQSTAAPPPHEVSFFEYLEKIELYCSKKNNNEKSFSELRFCEMIVLVLAFLDFSEQLQSNCIP